MNKINICISQPFCLSSLGATSFPLEEKFDQFHQWDECRNANYLRFEIPKSFPKVAVRVVIDSSVLIRACHDLTLCFLLVEGGGTSELLLLQSGFRFSSLGLKARFIDFDLLKVSACGQIGFSLFLHSGFNLLRLMVRFPVRADFNDSRPLAESWSKLCFIKYC